MRIRLVAVGTRLPAWQQEGYLEYVRRLPRQFDLHLVEVPAARRTKSADPAAAAAKEGDRMLAAIPDDAYVLALDERGVEHTTRELARRLGAWRDGGRDVALLIGGADGLARACLARADARWSLSRLTLPHGLARVLVAEQIYRAWTILGGHPYHRA